MASSNVNNDMANQNESLQAKVDEDILGSAVDPIPNQPDNKMKRRRRQISFWAWVCRECNKPRTVKGGISMVELLRKYQKLSRMGALPIRPHKYAVKRAIRQGFKRCS